MPITFSRAIGYRQIDENTWGAFVGFQCIATAPTEQAVRDLVSSRHR